MLDKYVKIIDEIKEQVLSLTVCDDEDGLFIMRKDFMRFRFKK